MARKTNRPRGEGQYHARIQMGCRVHENVDIVLSSADDSSWRLARMTVEQTRPLRIECLRYTSWFVRQPWRPDPLSDVRGDQIEDDVPF